MHNLPLASPAVMAHHHALHSRMTDTLGKKTMGVCLDRIYVGATLDAVELQENGHALARRRIVITTLHARANVQMVSPPSSDRYIGFIDPCQWARGVSLVLGRRCKRPATDHGW